MSTEQQEFWIGNFGVDYINRNQSSDLQSSNLNFFAEVFSDLEIPLTSTIEFGANVGMNCLALKSLFPDIRFTGVEINNVAFELLGKIADLAICSSIENFTPDEKFDLAFTKTVLIHLNPNSLKRAYENLYESSNKYILIAEYYNPIPVSVVYRGHGSKLFKRDFASEIQSMYPDLQLVKYGFRYHRGAFPQDDVTWFLLMK
jgi:pseudaminic acid biosynthesis-associated methylase